MQLLLIVFYRMQNFAHTFRFNFINKILNQFFPVLELSNILIILETINNDLVCQTIINIFFNILFLSFKDFIYIYFRQNILLFINYLTNRLKIWFLWLSNFINKLLNLLFPFGYTRNLCFWFKIFNNFLVTVIYYIFYFFSLFFN